MNQQFFTFSQLLSLPVAHTDAGDFLLTDKGPQKQFIMKGTITKARAGLFFIQIEDKSFTTHKNSQFSIGQEVACVIEPIFKEGQVKDFIISGLEQIKNNSEK